MSIVSGGGVYVFSGLETDVGGRRGRLHVLPPLSLFASSAGLLITAEIARNHTEPTAASAVVWTAVAVGVFLVLMTVAIVVTIDWAASRRYRVFCARRICLSGFTLLELAAVISLSMAWQGAFGHVRAEFRIGSGDIADAGSLLAAVICVVMGTVALVDAHEARGRERRWPDVLPDE